MKWKGKDGYFLIILFRKDRYFFLLGSFIRMNEMLYLALTTALYGWFVASAIKYNFFCFLAHIRLVPTLIYIRRNIGI